MLESWSFYYQGENYTEPDEGELIWGKYTEEQWEQMTPDEAADAFWEYYDSKSHQTFEG